MKLKAVLTAATVGLALVGSSVTPASAATGYDRCPNFMFCAFTGLNGTGAFAYWSNGDGNLSDNIGPTGMNNNIESIWNRSGHTWDLWDGIGYSGTHTTSAPYVGHNNVVPQYRNTVSSLLDN